MRLYEKYRPRRLGQVIGQDKAVNRLAGLVKRGAVGGNMFWLSGPSGTGKTTLARILARSVADQFFIEEVDSSSLTVSRLGEIESAMRLYSWGKGGRAYIINEAHGLRRDVIRQLLVLAERLPAHVVIVFTTTREGQEQLFEGVDDTGPLLSRCVCVPLTNQGLAKPFARFARRVAQREGLDGRPAAAYLRLVQDRKNNLRAVLQDVALGAMSDE